MQNCCSWTTLYKGFFAIVCALLVVEYFFGSTFETRKWETYLLNTTRIPTSVKVTGQHSFHKPSSIMNNSTTAYLVPINSTKTSTFQHQNGENVANTLFRLSKMISNANRTTNSPSSHSNSNPILDLRESVEKNNSSELPPCPDPPPNLQGRIKVRTKNAPLPRILESRLSWLKLGGHWSPTTCKPPNKVAIVVPYRCRGEHLLLFLQHMHPFLKRQLLDYTIFVVEQNGSQVFNRAMLMNIGFKEALKLDNYDCFIFHDVDLLPEDDRNLYTCPNQPRHMSVAIDTFRYKLPYQFIFGGVGAISTKHFTQLNGFSNSFWGWGGEDDDFSNRIRFHKLHISRYPIFIARYTMLSHKRDKPNPKRYDILSSGMKKFDTDGLNSLKYSVVTLRQNLLYTWVLVDIKPPS
ncbi:beta-1,4-N-acetylgalactosaminyltransferase bre-4 [Agrilus planipennis]|uniref:Beta-1,4-N-acetylgalactosaminyltransferase n=1 Tax=Agrilus planipennis TaxID=224129 RepID=A0A7F5RM22_AGRPL|nr:beta-1,4-N-acetylgalactosaminyltransferase bre-4 [Agrilus planipennis]